VSHEQRARVVEVARSYLNTPYLHMGRRRGAGVDCLTLLAEVYREAGVTGHVQVPFYPKDWMHHRSAELYMLGLLQHMHEIPGPPLPGDVALWKFGRCFSHGAIVVQWPHVIHAYAGRCVTLENAEAAAWLNFIGENTEDHGKVRPRKFFSRWE
jgi:cell wall-associated NlpC family hydrolase